jgi:hypothetical protein
MERLLLRVRGVHLLAGYLDAREIYILRRFIICAFYQIGLSNEG